MSAISITGQTWLICGGRNFADAETFNNAMSDLIYRRGCPAKIIHGGANGADTLAAQWASRMGLLTKVYEAQWSEHGKAAGPIRNQEMIETGPHFVVAFPGGKGTADMVSRARKAGVSVAEIKAT